MAAGRYNLRCRFERPNAAQDGYGNRIDGAWVHVATVWGDLDEKPGDERSEAGGQQSEVKANLVIRRTGLTQNLSESDRVIISGGVFNIRAISVKDRSGEMTLQIERGVAT